MFFPFNSWTLPDILQKRLLGFLLKKAVGTFIDDDFSLDNIDVQLSSGIIKLRDLPLNLDKINDLLQNTAIRLHSGKIGTVTLSIPWSSLLSADTILTFENVDFEFLPLPETSSEVHTIVPVSEYGYDSTIMASSMIVAREFLDLEGSEYFDVPEFTPSEYLENSPSISGGEDSGGLQILANFIDDILARFKVEAKNIRIKYSESPTTLEKGLIPTFIEAHIPNIQFHDENTQKVDDENKKPAVTNKVIKLSPLSISLYKPKGISDKFLDDDDIYEDADNGETKPENNESNFTEKESDIMLDYVKIPILKTYDSEDYIKFSIIHNVQDKWNYSENLSQYPDSIEVRINGIFSMISVEEVMTIQDLLKPLSKNSTIKSQQNNPQPDRKLDSLSNVLNDFITLPSSGNSQSHTSATGIVNQPSIHTYVQNISAFVLLDSLDSDFDFELAYEYAADTTLSKKDIKMMKIGELINIPHIKISLDDLNISYEILNKRLTATIDDMKFDKWNLVELDNSYTKFLYFNRYKDIANMEKQYSILSSEPYKIFDYNLNKEDEKLNKKTLLSLKINLKHHDIREKGRMNVSIPYTHVDFSLNEIIFILQFLDRIKDKLARSKTQSSGANRINNVSAKNEEYFINIKGLFLSMNILEKGNKSNIPFGFGIEVLNLMMRLTPSYFHYGTSLDFPGLLKPSFGANRFGATFIRTDVSVFSVLLLDNIIKGDKVILSGKPIFYLNNIQDYVQGLNASVSVMIRNSVDDMILSRETENVYSTEYGLRFAPIIFDSEDPMESWFVIDNNKNQNSNKRNNHHEKFLKFKEQTIAESMIIINAKIPSVKSYIDRFSYIKLRYGIDHIAYTLSKSNIDQDKSFNVNLASLGLRKPTSCSILLNIHNISANILPEDDINPLLNVNSKDFTVFSAINHESSGLTYLWADTSIFDISILNMTHKKFIKSSTDNKSSNSPAILFSLLLRNNATNDSNNLELAVNLFDISINAHNDATSFLPITEFFKDPPNLKFIQTNTSNSEIFLNSNNICILYHPLNVPVKSSVFIKSVKTKVKIDASQLSSINLFTRKGSLYIRDDFRMMSLPPSYDELRKYISYPDYFTEFGYVPVVDISSMDLLFKPSVNGVSYLILYDNQISVNVCGDSFETLKLLADYIGNNGDNNVVGSSSKFNSPLGVKLPEPVAFNHNELKDIDNNMFGKNSTFNDNRNNLKNLSLFASSFETINIIQYQNGNSTHQYNVNDIIFKPKFFNHATILNDDSPVNINESKSKLSIRVKNIEFTMNIYEGYDWEKSRLELFDKIAEYRSKLDKYHDPSVISPTSDRDSSHFNINDFKWALDKELGKDIRNITANNLSRSINNKISIKSFGAFVDFDIYEDDNALAWKSVFGVKDFEIIDSIKSSLWHKFCGYDRSKDKKSPREKDSNMITIIMDAVKPLEETLGLEHRLDVKILPLRMYIDQDALRCIIRFFSHERPKDISNLNEISKPKSSNNKNIFFQICDIHTLSLKVDYKPKYVDFRHFKNGNISEVINFFRLEEAALFLRPVRLSGISGFDALGVHAMSQWIPQLNRQISGLVSGVSGVRSIVNVGIGVKDLIKTPIEGYQKGKTLYGLQKGARLFVKATAMETIKLTTRLAVSTQGLLEQADKALNPKEYYESSRDKVSKFSEQPKDVKEGLGFGYRSLRANVNDAATSILSSPVTTEEAANLPDTFSAVLKAVPVAVIKPMIGTAEAVTKTLVGVQNSIDPAKRHQMEDKYKG